MVDRIINTFENDAGIDLTKDQVAVQCIREAAENAKIELSSTSLMAKAKPCAHGRWLAAQVSHHEVYIIRSLLIGDEKGEANVSVNKVLCIYIHVVIGSCGAEDAQVGTRRLRGGPAADA